MDCKRTAAICQMSQAEQTHFHLIQLIEEKECEEQRSIERDSRIQIACPMPQPPSKDDQKVWISGCYHHQLLTSHCHKTKN